jgi:S-adenosylmethionine-diacylgycerolhomoserine-N-methlytransferase
VSAAASHMDRMYRHQRHIYDASRKFYLLGRDGLIRELQPPSGGSVLEIGCGTARNLILAARAYPNAIFHGVDISAQMLATARKSIDAENLSHRVRVAEGDAARFDANALFGCGEFDRVFISYALSMIPPWREALENAFDLVAPSGSLHVVDFGEFSALPKWFGAGMKSWLGAFSVTPRAAFEAELSAIAQRRGMSCRVVEKFRGYAVHAIVVAPGSIGGGRSYDRDAGVRERSGILASPGRGAGEFAHHIAY